MAEETKDDMSVEPYGSEAMKSYYKALRKAMRVGRKGMERLDPSDVRAHLEDHLGAMNKACSAMRKAHGKWYPKNMLEDDDLIEKSFDEEDGLMDKAVETDMSAVDSTEGGSLIPDEPEDNPDAAEDAMMTHEEPDGDEIGSAYDKAEDLEEEEEPVELKSIVQLISEKQQRLAQLLQRM